MIAISINLQSHRIYTHFLNFRPSLNTSPTLPDIPANHQEITCNLNGYKVYGTALPITKKGEKQLCEYLEHFDLETRYMLKFNFNQKIEQSIKDVAIVPMTIHEATVKKASTAAQLPVSFGSCQTSDYGLYHYRPTM